MRSTKEVLFERKVSRRTSEIESEAQARQAEEVRRQQVAERRVADRARQQEVREARKRNHQGHSPEEIWGERSSEATVCNEFLAYMKVRDFLGSKLLTHKAEIAAQPKPKRRWLRKDIVQPATETNEDTWSVRGYGIGFTPQHPWADYERNTIYHETYPYPDQDGDVYQDIFLCEDGMVRKLSGDKLSPLDSIDNQNPNVPKTPDIGAVTHHYRYYFGGGQYSVADAELNDLLVQIATYHTQVQPDSPK